MENLTQKAPDYFESLEQVIALLEYRKSNSSSEVVFVIEDLLGSFKRTKESGRDIA